MRDLRVLYPGPWPLAFVELCSATEPHQHLGAPCHHPGKVPLANSWNRNAMARWADGVDPAAHLARMTRHLESGGNFGLAIPPGVVVLDADTPEAVAWLEQALPDAPLQQTGRGSHFVVRVPGELEISARGSVEIAEGVRVDVRAPGKSQVVVEPSVHASGATYRWKRPLPGRIEDLPMCPPLILDAIVTARAPGSSSPSSASQDIIPRGRRNSTLTSIAGTLRRKGLEAPEIEAALQVANRNRCDPPLDHREVERIAASVARYEPGEGSVTSVTSVEGWDPPIEFEGALTGPAIPLEILPPPLRDYSEEVCESYQVAPELAVGCQIGVLAGAGARRAEVLVGETHQEPLNLYIFPTAHPGERKIALREIARPLEQAEKQLAERDGSQLLRQQQLREITQQQIKDLQRRAAKSGDRADAARETAELLRNMPPEAVMPRLLMDDATPEAVGRALAQHGGVMAIVSEEAGSLFEVLGGRYSQGSPVLDVHLKAYDGGQIRVDRITREPVFVDRPALTIVATPQPALIERIGMVEEFRGRGLLGRCCFILAESRVGTRMYQNRSIDPMVRSAYQKTIRDIALLPIAPADRVPLLRLQGEALEVWSTYADEVERQQADGGRYAGIRDFASKHAGRVARMAGLFHLVRHHRDPQPWQHLILPEDVAAAWALGGILLDHALAAFAAIGLDPDIRLAKQVLAWIRKHRPNEFTLRDLYQHHRRVGLPTDLLPPLEILTARGFLRRQPEPTPSPKGGRPPSPRWLVNPLTHAQNSHNSQNHPDERHSGQFGEFCDLRERSEL